MKHINNPSFTQDELLSFFRYDPKTGELFWKYNPNRHRHINTINAGKRAGSIWFRPGRRTKYWHVQLYGRVYGQHRIIWCMVYGEWPQKNVVIDHTNGDGADNRLCNLRLVKQGANKVNSIKHKNNTSGIVGVSFNKSVGKWQSRISVDKKLIHLGTFNTKLEAAQARRAAEEKYYPGIRGVTT